jgi:HAD superfamily hydrolase (TIGR01509 family)
MDLLELFRDKGIPMAIASSSPSKWINSVLDRFSLRGFFPTVISGEDAGINGKPNPAIFLMAARKLDVRSDRCLVIEDSENGVSAAKAAGMKCIGLTAVNMVRQDLSRADLVVDEIGELFAKQEFLRMIS